MATTWTLANIVSKIQDDFDLHEETFVTTDDIKQLIEDAITDAEEIIIDSFSDFFLTYEDLSVEEGDTSIALPEDIYESRMRGLYYSESGFDGTPARGDAYKVKKISLQRIMDAGATDRYTYRLMNSTAEGQKIHIFPAIDADSDNKFRIWYIRQAKRLDDDDDVLEKGLRIQYIFAHVKKAVAEKLGDPILEVYDKKLMQQEDKLKNSLSRLTDDDEDVYLEPDEHALSEAYGIDDY